MTETAEALPAWQHGYDLEELRSIAAVFKAMDRPFVLGAFTGFKERDVAQALHDGQLLVRRTPAGAPVAALVWRRLGQNQGVKDFTGHTRARMQAGDIHVSRMAWLPGCEIAAEGLLGAVVRKIEPGAGQALFLSVWQESTEMRRLVSQLPGTPRLVSVKIPASSELIGVYAVPARGREVEHEPLATAERWGLRRLALEVPDGAVQTALQALERLPEWATHYSSYNKGHAWAALALRGYGGPDCIVKPAEMSKGWKAENAGMLDASCTDTELRAQLPELEPLISLVPGEHQRIRLMRLQPGGGELTRHADITDPEAGTGHRKVLRIHLPLVTNDDVKFSSWSLVGERYTRNMGVGSAWYLDTRKPHTAVNGGTSPRVHLVVDAYSTPDLLDMLERGSDA